MELNDSEVNRLRREFFDLLVAELKEASVNGQLVQVREHLAAPIAAVVHESVLKAMAMRPEPPASSGLSDSDLKRIAALIAHGQPVAVTQTTVAEPVSEQSAVIPAPKPAEPADLATQLMPDAGLGAGPSDKSRQGREERTSGGMPHWLGRYGPVVVALLAGLAIGYFGPQLFAPPASTQAEMDDTVVVSEPVPKETGAGTVESQPAEGVAPVSDPAAAATVAPPLTKGP